MKPLAAILAFALVVVSSAQAEPEMKILSHAGDKYLGHLRGKGAGRVFVACDGSVIPVGSHDKVDSTHLSCNSLGLGAGIKLGTKRKGNTSPLPSVTPAGGSVLQGVQLVTPAPTPTL